MKQLKDLSKAKKWKNVGNKINEEISDDNPKYKIHIYQSTYL